MNARLLARLNAPLAFASIAFFVACGGVPNSEEEMGGSTSAVERLEGDDYIGDQGGGAEAGEVDPTKQPGFSLTTEHSRLAAVPDKAVLTFTWKGQETGYWCGPGSARIAISTHDTTPPTQTELAKFLGTTSEGTVRADEIRALNNYLEPAIPYASIPMDTVPTQAQRDLLKVTVVSRIAAGWPVVANVLSGWRPPGYPTGTIGHFVAVVGYDDKGDKVLIADPAGEGAPSPRWNDVPRSYWISMQNLGTWIGGRGYSGDLPPAPAPL